MATQVFATVKEFAAALIAIGKTIGNLINQALQAGLHLLKNMVRALLELGRTMESSSSRRPASQRASSPTSSAHSARSGRQSPS